MQANTVSPFLSRIFLPSVEPKLTETWVYSKHEIEVYGGYSAHRAVDFAVPIGTPVVAAADGLAVASFEEARIRFPSHQPRLWHGEPVFWGFGLFVLVYHENGLFSGYGHLHRLADNILKHAYVIPNITSPEDVETPLATLTAGALRRFTPISVKRGDIIGYSGITGMGIGVPTYVNWLSNHQYRSNDEPHVHFSVSEPPALSTQTTYIDPFGIYGLLSKYPDWHDDWSLLPKSAWIA